MRIERYFEQVRETLDSCPYVATAAVTCDRRGTHEGFIRGDVFFRDGSALHFREYVDVEATVDRLAYAYQYMEPSRRLVFRYDNTGPHKELGPPSYPHHKHDGSEQCVVGAGPQELASVLAEIESHMTPLC